MEPINDAAWGDNGDRKAPREGPSTIKRKKRLAERENQPPPPVAPAKDKASTSRVSTGKLDLKRIIFKYTISQRKQSTPMLRTMQFLPRRIIHIVGPNHRPSSHIQIHTSPQLRQVARGRLEQVAQTLRMNSRFLTEQRMH